MTPQRFMDFISGKWNGEYIYGNGYEDKLRGKTVRFSMELFADGDLIRGTCTDDETKVLFSKPATIEGSFEHDTFIFYKTYPKQPGLVGASALIAENYSSTIIQYTGALKKKFFSPTRYFEGIWEINGSYLDENRNARYYALNGTWKMKKA
jgi:hypothetical protein